MLSTPPKKLGCINGIRLMFTHIHYHVRCMQCKQMSGVTFDFVCAQFLAVVVVSNFLLSFRLFVDNCLVEYKSTEFMWAKETMGIGCIGRCQSRGPKTLYGNFKDYKSGKVFSVLFVAFFLSTHSIYLIKKSIVFQLRFYSRLHGMVQILLCFLMSQ